MSLAAILPSRNEPSTIAAVTRAIDTALDASWVVIVHADSSDVPETASRFADTPTRAAKVSLSGLVRGKGAQILAATNGHDVPQPLAGDLAVSRKALTATWTPPPAPTSRAPAPYRVADRVLEPARLEAMLTTLGSLRFGALPRSPAR
jgi:hypothetical protein